MLWVPGEPGWTESLWETCPDHLARSDQRGIAGIGSAAGIGAEIKEPGNLMGQCCRDSLSPFFWSIPPAIPVSSCRARGNGCTYQAADDGGMASHARTPLQR